MLNRNKYSIAGAAARPSIAQGADVTVLDDATVLYPACRPVRTDAASQSDLTRPVYCILGMPIDAINLSSNQPLGFSHLDSQSKLPGEQPVGSGI